jgi:hypothetical protein
MEQQSDQQRLSPQILHKDFHQITALLLILLTAKVRPDQQDPKVLQGLREHRDLKDLRDLREQRDLKDLLDLREQRDLKDLLDLREQREP